MWESAMTLAIIITSARLYGYLLILLLLFVHVAGVLIPALCLHIIRNGVHILYFG